MDKQLDTVKRKLDECGATTEEHAGMSMSMALEPYGPSGMIPFPFILCIAGRLYL
jgi:hypothetical protein